MTRLPAGLVRVHGGTAEARAALLDRLLLRADVVAVVESEDRIELRLEAPIEVAAEDRAGAREPARAAHSLVAAAVRVPAGVVVEPLPDPDGPPPTGLEHDRPIRVADDLWIRPPWVARPELPPGAIELVVPRGGAFGSGEHESTKAALRLLHAAWPRPGRDDSERAAAGPHFVDVGCGSGVLTAYALARGAGRVDACDIEGPAVRAATELAHAQAAPGTHLAIVRGGPADLRCAPASADVVVANMTWPEIDPCIGTILGLLRPDGLLVLSGVRADERPARDRAVGRAPDLRDESGETWLGAAWRGRFGRARARTADRSRPHPG